VDKKLDTLSFEEDVEENFRKFARVLEEANLRINICSQEILLYSMYWGERHV